MAVGEASLGTALRFGLLSPFGCWSEGWHAEESLLPELRDEVLRENDIWQTMATDYMGYP